MLLQAILSQKPTYTTIMDEERHSTISCSEMQGQQSLMFRSWRLLGHGSDIFTSVFAEKGGCKFDYKLLAAHSRWIVRDAKPSMVDALLTLSFWKGQ
jgi:hypothetical protein